MAEDKRRLPSLEVLAQIHNPGRWENIFLVFAVKRCRLLWLDIGVPSELANCPTFLSAWAIEALQKESSFCYNLEGTKQEFLSQLTSFWETAQRDFFSRVIRQYGVENGRHLYHWCYWQGGTGSPLQFANKKHRNSTWSILRAWGCVITDMVYHYAGQRQCDAGECPSLPPELLDWIEAAEDVQNLKEPPEVVPEFNDQGLVNENDVNYAPLMLPDETISLIRQTMFNYYHPDVSIDDDRVADMLAKMETVPLEPRELELLKYTGTEYHSDEEDAPPRYVEKYVDLELTLGTLHRHHRVYSVVRELEKLLKESEKKALVDWARRASVYPPYGNPNALLWPSEVGEEEGKNMGGEEKGGKRKGGEEKGVGDLQP